jgi:hypothetical protein
LQIASRFITGIAALKAKLEIAELLRNATHYPLFAKPMEGKYRLGVISASSVDAVTVTLRGSANRAIVNHVAQAISKTAVKIALSSAASSGRSVF